MGVIKNNHTGVEIILFSDHHFGRGIQNRTRLTESCISRTHAVIRWDESGWQIIDHSKNGTIIDGRFIYHASKKLTIGSKIQFGEEESTVWEFIDDNRPSSYLISNQNPSKVFELAFQNLLPNRDNPEVSFFKTDSTIWSADIAGDIIELTNGCAYNFANEEWEYVENESLESTTDSNNIVNQSYFLFSVSRDEEEVDIKIIVNDLQLDLGIRIYNHILLKLVRQRIADERNGCDVDQLGWVSMDEMTGFLSKELLKEVDDYYLNIQIYRLRNKIMELKPYGYLFSNIIERKKGELRFNHPYFKIVKGETQTAQIKLAPKTSVYL